MNQAVIGPVVSALRVPVHHHRKKLSTPLGPEGRINKLRKTVTALVQHERLELNYPRADEARGYAERLISEAIRHGDTHEPTMELASFWLLQKELVHKLFKVLAPRFEDCKVSYTRMYKAPRSYPGSPYVKAVLELRGNPYPNLKPSQSSRNMIHNVLIDAAKYDYRQKKYAEIAANITAETPEPTAETTPKEIS
ncbi:mitochondrial ribosomal protein L17 [Arctopsyche grandis]|uniref:mitochondrial ribosomal protein L17 n=1 Tax=Arctopsyche grandis TaxID=121162 RepID=UPI00406D9FC7